MSAGTTPHPMGKLLKLKGPGGIVREFHHLKVLDQDPEIPGQIKKPRFERAMMLYRPELKGRSCYIPDSCGWKYLDPKDNLDVHDNDVIDFAEMLKELALNVKLRPMGNFHPEFEAIRMSKIVNEKSQFMRMTGYFLSKTLQLLEVDLTERNVYRLLSYVQDGLRDLQTMKLPLPEEVTEIGESTFTLWRNDEPIVREVPLTVKAGELKTGVIH